MVSERKHLSSSFTQARGRSRRSRTPKPCPKLSMHLDAVIFRGHKVWRSISLGPEHSGSQEWISRVAGYAVLTLSTGSQVTEMPRGSRASPCVCHLQCSLALGIQRGASLARFSRQDWMGQSNIIFLYSFVIAGKVHVLLHQMIVRVS